MYITNFTNVNFKMQSPICHDRELPAVVPQSLLHDVSCYVLYEHHPMDRKSLDIVVCTTVGEVIELSCRRIMSTVTLGDNLVPREINIYRNNENEKFYVVSTLENLFVISTKCNLSIHKCFDHIERYTIDDLYCKGFARIRIWHKEDAVPIVLDDSFNISIEEEAAETTFDTSSNFISSLQSKLTAAHHTVNVNKERYKKLLNFRQDSMHIISRDMCPNDSDSLFKSCEKVTMHTSMQVQCLTPWLKLCNGKVIIGVSLTNQSSSTSFNNIKFILQSNTDSSISYRTKIYTSIEPPPFWREMDSDTLAPMSACTVVAVTNIEEFVLENKVKYTGVVMYELNGNKKFVPLREIILSCMDTLSENFDLLSSNTFDRDSFLAVLSTTSSIELRMKYVHTFAEDLPLQNVFQDSLKMKKVDNTNNTLIHVSSPYHVLNGVMIIFEDSNPDGSCEITVYLRNNSQLTSLLHLIYDKVPHRLLVITPNTCVQSKNSIKYTRCAMDVDDCSLHMDTINKEFKCVLQSLLKQMKLILEYFDKCMTAMASRSDQSVGTKINLMAPGAYDYSLFRSEMFKELKHSSLYFKM